MPGTVPCDNVTMTTPPSEPPDRPESGSLWEWSRRPADPHEAGDAARPAGGNGSMSHEDARRAEWDLAYQRPPQGSLPVDDVPHQAGDPSDATGAAAYGAGPDDTSDPAGATTGRRAPRWRRLLGPLAALGFLVFKFGAKLKFLLLLLPKIKLFTTSASMLVSIAAYSFIFGWKFAVGFVLLLFVHEMGHVFQARREGIATSAPMFIPFLGALIMLKEREKDAAVEARIGLAGPIIGGIACLVPVALWQATGDSFYQALAFTGFFLNLFNLLPVLPLDGGRAMSALSPVMWLVGFGALIAAAIFLPNPIMLLILLFGGIETWNRWKHRKSPESRVFLQVPGRTRFAVAGVYIGLAVALAFGMQTTFLERDLDDARDRDVPVQAG